MGGPRSCGRQPWSCIGYSVLGRHTETGDPVRSATGSLVATRSRLDVVRLCRGGVVACLVARFFGTPHWRGAALMAGDRRDALLFGDLLLR